LFWLLELRVRVIDVRILRRHARPDVLTPLDSEKILYSYIQWGLYTFQYRATSHPDEWVGS
jgi:hypothetical protein